MEGQFLKTRNSATRKIYALQLSDEARSAVRNLGAATAARSKADIERENSKAISTKFAQYVVLGGENYRELLSEKTSTANAKELRRLYIEK